MTEHPEKCICCNSEIPALGDMPIGDLCDRCKDNPTRQAFIKEVQRPNMMYVVCPIEGELVRIIGYDENGAPNKWKCPKCGKETQEPLLREYNPNPRRYEAYCDEKTQKFYPQLCANAIKGNYLFKTDRATKILYRYDEVKGAWSSDGETYLQEILALICGAENRLSVFNNVLHCLESVTLEDVEFSDLIACENGLLDVERGTLSDFTPNAMPNHAIPVKFDKEATCTNWLEFLKQIIATEDTALLQEWSGFLLLPDYRKHKILWIHGEGRNGKGVWVRTMEGILGQENCSSVSLEEFDGAHRFAMYRLHDKLFNPCSEPTTTKILQTPLLKKVTGQDTIDGEIKGKQERVSFRNKAKLTVIGNKFPKVNDTTLAFQDRMMFMKFPNEYIGKNQIDDLEKVWLNDPQERSGILNWMLEGLQHLLSNSVFTESKSQKETMLEFQRVSDSISAFLTEQCTLGLNRLTVRSTAYDCYKEYCDMIGTQPENDKAFTQRLKNTPKIKAGWTRVQGTRERAWEGFSVNPIQEEFATDATDATRPTYPLQLEDSSNIKERRKGVASVASVAEQDYPEKGV